ncbi:MAG TPA: response regulator [Opitutales bacterium]|jgi:CheY-like chemotaxis protein|nr:response regulator [Opitutales bacterium]
MAGKILVLDDEQNYAEMLRDLLVQEGFSAEMVTRPLDALKALDAEEYSLVVADYKMPVMDGADFMERARSRLPNLPIIMVSGLMNTPELVKVANMDVTLVLEKPLDIKAFINHVRRFVQPMTDEERTSAIAILDNAVKGPLNEYPALKHLAEGTDAARLFAQQLWDASRVDRYLFVGAQPGAETELVTCELSVWFGFANLPIHQFSISQIESLEVLQTIRELPGQNQVSKLVAVTDFGEATHSQIELLQKLLAADPKFLPNGREVSWVFYLDVTRYPQLLPETSPEIFNLVKKHLVVLPPLRDRLPDLATYLKLHLELFAGREENPMRSRLTPAAVAVLLAHSWPGNYAEVVDVARRIAATERDGPLTGLQAAELLGHTNAEPAGLGGYLLQRQREFLEDTARRTGTTPFAVLQSLKLDPALLPKSSELDDLGLLYMDLVPG